MKFLLFESFIAPTLIITLCYTGVILFTLFTFMIYRWLRLRLQALQFDILSLRIRLVITVGAVLIFVFIQLCWRVAAEMFLAYFDMHDALMSNRNKEERQ